MKLIELTKGHQAMVDDEDYEYLNKWKWCTANKKNELCYAVRSVKYYINDKRYNSHVSMHRLIMGITDPKIPIDHIDRNGLNNQKSNLRLVDSSQNGMNRRKKGKGLSMYKGVSAIKRTIQEGIKIDWIATCTKHKIVYTRAFKTEIEAAEAYNVMALGLHGKYAVLNIIENGKD